MILNVVEYRVAQDREGLALLSFILPSGTFRSENNNNGFRKRNRGFQNGNRNNYQNGYNNDDDSSVDVDKF